MNALTTLSWADTGTKDPTSIAWSPTLPIELALKTASPEELRQEYGYTMVEWAELPRNPVFMRELAAACELVRQEGMSFKLKAKLIAEENLKQTWKMIHESKGDVPPATKAKLIELCGIWAGFDARANRGSGEGGAAGPVAANTLNIQINLGPEF